MRRIRSELHDMGGTALALCGISLLLVLCCCVLVSHHTAPRYGVRVRPAASHFTMGGYDRSQTHILSVSAGEEPRLYDGSERIAGDMQGVEPLLTQWAGETPSRVTVVLVADSAVTAGTLQQLTDMVLSHGMNCHLGAVPSIE